MPVCASDSDTNTTCMLKCDNTINLFLCLQWKMAAAEIEIECSYCWLKGEDFLEPTVLPCQHLACKKCVIGHYEHNNRTIIRCPNCQ